MLGHFYFSSRVPQSTYILNTLINTVNVIEEIKKIYKKVFASNETPIIIKRLSKLIKTNSYLFKFRILSALEAVVSEEDARVKYFFFNFSSNSLMIKVSIQTIQKLNLYPNTFFSIIFFRILYNIFIATYKYSDFFVSYVAFNDLLNTVCMEA